MSNAGRTGSDDVGAKFWTNEQLVQALAGGGREADTAVMRMLAERIQVSAASEGTADPAQVLLSLSRTVLALQVAVEDLAKGYGHRRLKEPGRQAELARALDSLKVSGADLHTLADWVR